VAIKVRLFGIVLCVLSVLLAFQLLSLFGAHVHFGSPALQTCMRLQSSPELGEPCRIWRSQVNGLTRASMHAFELLFLSAGAALLLGVAAIVISLEKPSTPPNNSSKPTPLRGAA
jgi:hypothetical protein